MFNKLNLKAGNILLHVHPGYRPNIDKKMTKALLDFSKYQFPHFKFNC